MPTVKLPVVGTVERRYVIIGGATVVVIVGYVWWRRRQTATAAAAATTDSTTGSSLPGDVPFSNPVPGALGDGTVDTTGGTAVTSNDQWSNKVIGLLANDYNTQYMETTLGKYLDGQPLTQDEASFIRAAWAVAGHPPQDKSIILATSGGSTPGNGNPPPTPPPTPKPGPPRRYAVVRPFSPRHAPWDTLSGIAGASGRSVSELAAWNKITNVNVVHPGDHVWVDPPGNYTGSKRIN